MAVFSFIATDCALATGIWLGAASTSTFTLSLAVIPLSSVTVTVKMYAPSARLFSVKVALFPLTIPPSLHS